MNDYQDFLQSKARVFTGSGIEVEPESLHPSLFDWQRKLVAWALRKGRAALWTTTGSGKTRMQVEWAARIAPRALILAPLAVAQQTVREAAALDVRVTYARSMAESPATGITIANYEMLHHFDAAAFPAVVLDESSILRNFSGTVKRQLVETFRRTPYRLCCTATPAPNDVVELCNHADFLNIMSPADMLSRFFISKGDDAKSDRFRLKRHAREPFFRWLSSWAMAMQQPSDLGYSDEGWTLPPLEIAPVFVATDWKPEGHLFFTELKGIQSRSAARRATIDARIEATLALVQAEPDEQWLIWCGLNDEADRITAALPGAVNVQGNDSPDEKARALLGFADGEIRTLVTKPSIAAYGMNWQRCARMVFLGMNDSWEQEYQAVRRCWRFGQTRPVHVSLVLSTAEMAVYNNVMRKEGDAATLQRELVAAASRFEREELGNRGAPDEYRPEQPITLPDWLTPAPVADMECVA